MSRLGSPMCLNAHICTLTAVPPHSPYICATHMGASIYTICMLESGEVLKRLLMHYRGVFVCVRSPKLDWYIPPAPCSVPTLAHEEEGLLWQCVLYIHMAMEFSSFLRQQRPKVCECEILP